MIFDSFFSETPSKNLRTKGGKMRIQSKLSSSRNSGVINNILPDDLLMKILAKLPCKSAVQCKAVCKSWLSLISNPYFVDYFIRSHHHHQFNHSNFTILIRFVHDEVCDYHLATPSIIPLLKRHDTDTRTQFQLHDFLPCFKAYHFVKRIWPVRSVAYFNDLLVCARSPIRYDICNPLTKQRLKLPPAPKTHMKVWRVKVGFVCYPYNSCCKLKTCTNNARYSYKVVRVPINKGRGFGSKSFMKFNVEIFSSHSGEWGEFAVSSPKPLSRFNSIDNIVVYNGILHWMTEDGRFVVAYNPLNNMESCRLIDFPIHETNRAFDRRIGVCGGSLMLSTSYGRLARKSLSTWKLEDYNTGKWGCEKKLYFKDMVSKDEDSWLVEEAKYVSTYIGIIGFHPYDEHTFYFSFRNAVVSCNMGTRRLELVSKIEYSDDFDVRSMFYVGFGTVFPLLHPWWPTPVLPLPPPNADDGLVG